MCELLFAPSMVCFTMYIYSLFMALSLTRTLVLPTDAENSINDIASVYCIIDENSLASPFHDVLLVKIAGETGRSVMSVCIDEHNCQYYTRG